ncbi:MAG: hypothetical protein WAK48_33895 [Candidatus Acidiferrum sp.]|jgi:hypothetical protein
MRDAEHKDGTVSIVQHGKFLTGRGIGFVAVQEPDDAGFGTR